MLQRAASNAYSWWWASNIRTKQSKWLDSNLQDMEEKVKTMIKLIEVDADSFAKKAEMYYRRRPELISFVEETFRAYKALADRYDRISGELHKANHTLASAFPDQVQFDMHDDDEDGSPRAFTAIDPSKFRKPTPREMPQLNLRSKNRDTRPAFKKQEKRVNSHVTKENAQEEIDKLQKEILILQTEKEYVKSSYETGMSKFWEIERQITELQDEVCTLQDEFSACSIIDDDEARALMAATALKSCEESLFNIQKQQERSSEEAWLESTRIKDAKHKIKVLKGENCSPENEETYDRGTNLTDVGNFGLKNEMLNLHAICEQVNQHFQLNSDASVVDLAEKIDGLVEKVISLEVTISSQTAQIQNLRSETDELQKHLRGLEQDKANLIVDSNSLNDRLKQAEDELHRIQELEKSMNDGRGLIETHFVEACHSLNDISEKLQSPRYKEQDGTSADSNVGKEVEKLAGGEVLGAQEGPVQAKQQDFPVAEVKQVQSLPEKDPFQIPDKSHAENFEEMASTALGEGELHHKGEISDWQQLLNNEPEDRLKMLLYEYTSILRNYKETKNRMTEMEKKNQQYHFETMEQIQELRSANAVKDQEIRALRRKLFSHNPSKDTANSKKEDHIQNQEEKGNSIQVITAKLDFSTEVVDTKEELKLGHITEKNTTSPTEEKFRAELDSLLEENIDFWLRFSTSYHQIQKFDANFKELESSLHKLKDSEEEGSASASPNQSSKQESAPLEKKLRGLHTELQVWLEQNGLLKGELLSRFMSLCNIQEEISKVSRDSEGEDAKFTPYQAAKFQGELHNMQQENNKVAKELQTGLDHVKALQSEVAKVLSKLRESFDLSGSRGQQQYQNFRHLSTKSKVPLRTFLFGEKRKKPSLFSCISPAMHKQYHHTKSGFPS
ncbi:hypothetical protein HPP92_015569 [Vanilla planifolia]|uniref:NAB domain-containing protein n=1 Tax=Vanilla planifolia TaxID=51239 RepID=A0A835QTU8_VANPL|nr:hypothetical protein HPP92_015569 [Vanilla planifolia]